LYDQFIHSPSQSYATPPKSSSNQTPDRVPDKTGNNRNTPSETTNNLLLPTPPPKPSAQTHSNETPDRVPDKTGNNREIKLKKINFVSPLCPSKRDSEKLRGVFVGTPDFAKTSLILYGAGHIFNDLI
jgi:hypothetical protein